MLLPVTLTVAAAAAVGSLILAYRIVRVRLSERVLFGDGGHALLGARIRAQANFVEYMPFILILMALIEAGGGSSRWLGVLGGVIVMGRIAHAIGMDRPTSNPWRAGGALATWTVLFGLALWALALAYGGSAPKTAPVIPIDGTPTA